MEDTSDTSVVRPALNITERFNDVMVRVAPFRRRRRVRLEEGSARLLSAQRDRRRCEVNVGRLGRLLALRGAEARNATLMRAGIVPLQRGSRFERRQHIRVQARRRLAANRRQARRLRARIEQLQVAGVLSSASLCFNDRCMPSL